MANFAAQPVVAKQQNTLVKVGKAWNRTSQAGKPYISISLDKQAFAQFTNLEPGDNLIMCANKPRPGHETGNNRDADYFVSIRKPIA